MVELSAHDKTMKLCFFFIDCLQFTLVSALTILEPQVKRPLASRYQLITTGNRIAPQPLVGLLCWLVANTLEKAISPFNHIWLTCSLIHSSSYSSQFNELQDELSSQVNEPSFVPIVRPATVGTVLTAQLMLN